MIPQGKIHCDAEVIKGEPPEQISMNKSYFRELVLLAKDLDKGEHGDRGTGEYEMDLIIVKAFEILGEEP